MPRPAAGRQKNAAVHRKIRKYIVYYTMFSTANEGRVKNIPRCVGMAFIYKAYAFCYNMRIKGSAWV